MEEELQIVQTQLTAAVKMQLDSASSALRTLESAQDQLHDIKASLHGTVELSRRSAALFDDPISPHDSPSQSAQSEASASVAVSAAAKRYHSQYALIKAVSTAHANFGRAKSIYAQLAGLERDADRAVRLLRDDYEGNMLLIAGIVSKLDNFRDETLRMLTPFSPSPSLPVSVSGSSATAATAATATPTLTATLTASQTASQTAQSTSNTTSGQAAVIFTLKRYFKRIDNVKQEFEGRFWEEPKRLFALLLNKQYPQIVKMAKVMVRMAPEARARMTGIFDELVQSKFAGVKAMMAKGGGGGEGTVADALKQLDFYRSDLLLLRDGLSTRFPEDMNIVTFFLLSYHRNIAQCIDGCVRFGDGRMLLSSGDTLELLSWTADYHRVIEDMFGTGKEDLEPQLLDRQLEQQLLGRFVTESAGKVAEWIGTLVKNECRLFQTRTAVPDLDADDHYYTVGVIDLCRIVKQTVETAATANLPALLLKVVTETMRAVQQVYLDSLQRATRLECAKQRDSSVSAPHLEEWLIAFGNNCMRWLTFTADFQDSFGGDYVEGEGAVKVDETTRTHLNKLFKQSNDAFLQFARQICDILADSVMTTLTPAWSQLLTADWSARPHVTVGTIDATMEDYFADWSARLDPFLFAKVVGDLFERSLAAVFDAMRSRPLKAAFEPLLQQDLHAITAFFGRHRDPAKLAKSADLANRLLKVVFATTPRILSLDAQPLLKQAPETAVLLEQWIMKRQDVDRQAFQDAIDGVKRRFKEEHDGATTTDTAAAATTTTATFLRHINTRTTATTPKQGKSKK